jgi:DNA polymerase-3 subunit delta'
VSWQRVRGHDHLVQAFEGVVRRGRLAHAYLFTGPSGVGKRLFAGELAKALLCETPPGPRLGACDRCPSCFQVAAGTHPDFLTAGRPEDALEVPIDTIRELCRGFALKSARGRGKVAILDDADDLNDAAANCFLKTLEEPPPRSVLILIGASADRQLPTIVSRCQVVRFAPLPEALVAELLRAHPLEDPGLAGRLARLSGGSIGQALALADPALWEFRGKLLAGLARPTIDGVGLARQWTEFVEEAGKESAAQRRRAALVLRLLVECFNEVLQLRTGATPRLADPADAAPLRALADRLDPDQLLAILERCLDADQQIDRRVQLVLIIEALVDAVGRRLAGAS